MSFLINPYIYAVAGGCSYISETDLVSYWKTDNSLTDEVGGNNGVFSGMSYDASPSVFSTSLGFSGASQSQADFGNSLDLQSISAFTLSCWVYPNVVNSLATVYDNYAGAAGPYRMFINSNQSTFQFTLGATTLTCPANTATVSTWHHVAMVMSSTSVASVYVNGTAYSIGASSPSQSTISHLIVGARKQTGVDAYNLHADVNVEDMSYWGRALTQEEINEIYSGGTTTGCRTADY